MKYQILKSIGAGILIGAALFAFPFTIRVIGTIVVIGFLVRLIRGPRWNKFHYMRMAYAGNGAHMHPHFQKMTEEERAAFMDKMSKRGCYQYTKAEVINKEENNNK